MAIEYLEQLNDKLRRWLPDNQYKTEILDNIRSRFDERTQKYRRMIR